MRKIYALLFAVFCTSVLIAQDCGTDEYHAYRMAHDSGYREQFLREKAMIHAAAAQRNSNESTQGVIQIPTVVHIIHMGEPVGTFSNIPDAQVFGAMQGINDRFRGLIDSTIDIGIEFCLASRDPNGCPTNGINRVSGCSVPLYCSVGMSYTNCGANSTDVQDLCRWPEDQYFNIYIVWQICSGAAGYSMSMGPNPYTGVVIGMNSFVQGSTTPTHECGHALGLPHTFEGDNGNQCPVNNNCLTDGDGICDTPPHRVNDCGAVNPCSATGDFNYSRYNYMSYCGNKLLFSPDQRTQMLSTINYYSSLQTSQGCVAPLFNVITPVVNNMSCYNVCDGSIAITQSAACVPQTYTYAWSTGATTSSVSGLCAGTYSVVITNMSSQTTTYSFVITNPQPLAVTASITPGGCGASAEATVSGGTPFVSSTLCGNGSTSGTIGTGTDPGNPAWYPAVYGNQNMGSRHQVLVLASELTAAGIVAGNINSVAYNIVSVQGTNTLDGFTIKMMHTNLSNLMYVVLGAQVVMNPQTITLTPGWNTHTLDFAFVWDGVSNIVIETCFNNSSTVPVNTQSYMSTTSFWSIAWNTDNSMNACTAYNGAFATIYRPNVQLIQCQNTNYFTYLWSDGQTTETATGLAPGTYTVTVTDAGGCTATGTCTVTSGDIDPLIVNANIAQTATCSSDAASTVSGGNPYVSPTLCGSGSTTAIVGTGTVTVSPNTYPSTYGNYYWGSRHQMLMTAAELSASGLVAGNITSISFDVYAALGNTSINGFTVKMKHTALTSVTAFDNTFQTVVNPQSLTVVAGWNLHTFDTPFTWDGVSNILIEICFNNSSWTAQNSQNNMTTTPFTSVIYSYVDASNACSNLTNTATTANRPNMRFTQCSDSLVYTYQWSDGQTTPDATGLTSGTYTLTVTDGDGCTGTATLVVTTGTTVNAGNDTIVLPSMPVTLGGSPTASGVPPYTYSWFPSTGLNSTTIANPVSTVTITTIYVLTTTDGNGCTYTDTVTVFVDPMLSVPAIVADGDFIVYPNPANDVLSVAGKEIENGMYSLRITNVLGQTMWQSEVLVNSGVLNEEISVANFPAGVFFLTVGNGESVFVRRVEVRN